MLNADSNCRHRVAESIRFLYQVRLDEAGGCNEGGNIGGGGGGGGKEPIGPGDTL